MSLHAHGNKIEKVTVYHNEEMMWYISLEQRVFHNYVT